MKKYLLLFTTIFSIVFFFSCTSNLKKQTKKKVLIFTSDIGGGHRSPTQTLCDTLGNDYDIEVVDYMKETISRHDPICKLTKGRKSSEEFFNFIAKNGWYQISNFLSQQAIRSLSSEKYQNKFTTATYHYLKKKNPDLVISVIGFVNYPISQATEKLNIPFIIVPTDLDQSYASHGFENALINKTPISNTYYLYSFAHEEIAKTLPQFSFDPEQIQPIGFPMRQQFFEKKDIQTLKEKWEIPLDKKIVFLSLGGLGGAGTKTWIEEMASSSKDLHFVVCIGRNKQLKKKLLNPDISMTIVEFTPNISDLMALSDLLIIKSGTNSFLEAINMKKPIVIDGTNQALQIEKFNCNLARYYQLAEIVENTKDIKVKVEKALDENNIANHNLFDSKDFSANIRKTVDEIFQDRPEKN
jgi:UDP-N-acetylglucosamine:LPS N-acetylglucosamine transferase